MLAIPPKEYFKVDQVSNFAEHEMVSVRQILHISYSFKLQYTPYSLEDLFDKMRKERKAYDQKLTAETSGKAPKSAKEHITLLMKKLKKKQTAAATQHLDSLFDNSCLLDILKTSRKKKNKIIAFEFCRDYALKRKDFLDLPSANLMLQTRADDHALINSSSYALPHTNRVSKLHLACEFGDLDTANNELRTTLPNITDYRGIQPLHVAAKSGSLQTVQCILWKLKQQNISPSQVKDIFGKTPLMYTLINSTDEHVLIAKELLTSDKNLIHVTDEMGFSALDYALCRSNSEKMINTLLEFGATFNITIAFDSLSIFYLFFTRTSWVKQNLLRPILLMLQSINVEIIAFPADSIPLSLMPEYIEKLILFHNNSKLANIVNGFLRKGGDLNLALSSGNTFLTQAVKCQNNEAARILLECRADVNQEEKGGYTALYFAILFHNNDIADQLIDNININFEKLLSINGENYLQIAIKSKNKFALKRLWDKMFWQRDHITLFGSSLIDYCIAFDFLEGIDIIMPIDNLMRHELTEHCKSTFAERIETQLKSLGTVLRYGILSRSEATQLGINQHFSMDGIDISASSSKMVSVNVITTKRGLSTSLSGAYRGSYSVVVERDNNKIKLKPNESQITANAIYELTRRANMSFIVYTSQKSLSLSDDYFHQNFHTESYEYFIQSRIPSENIDLILLPNHLTPYKHKISLLSSTTTIIFLDEVQLDKFAPNRNTLYIGFVGYDKEMFKYQTKSGALIDVEACVPKYSDSVFLIKYFEKTGGNIISHIVRIEDKTNAASVKSNHTEEQYEDSLSSTSKFLSELNALPSPPNTRKETECKAEYSKDMPDSESLKRTEKLKTPNILISVQNEYDENSEEPYLEPHRTLI